MNAQTLNTPVPALRPSPFGQALAVLDRAVTAALLLSVAVMVGVVSAQVALRYGLNRSIDWADEVGRLAFVWSIFLAIPLGVLAMLEKQLTEAKKDYDRVMRDDVATYNKAMSGKAQIIP